MPEEERGPLVQLPRSARVDPVPEGDARVGQIRLALPDRGSAVTVLIIEVDDGSVRGLLCGEDWPLATETDAVLEPWQSGCPGRLLVHGDVSAAILNRRLSRVLGAITPEIVERIVLRGLHRDFDTHDLGRGRPILDRDDPRWEWKLEQLTRVRGVRARASEVGFTLHESGRGGRGGRDSAA